MAAQAADAAFIIFTRRRVEAGGMAGQAFLRAALLRPGFLESGVNQGIAVGALFPVTANSFVTTHTLLGIGDWRGVLPQRGGRRAGNVDERQDHQERADERAVDNPLVH